MAKPKGAALAELGQRAIELADKGEASSIVLFDELVSRIQQLPDSADNSLILAQALFYRGRAYSFVSAVLDLDKASTDLRRASRLYSLFSDTKHEAECRGQLGVVAARRYEREVAEGGPKGRRSEAYLEAEQSWKTSSGMSQNPAALDVGNTNLASLYMAGEEWSLARDIYAEMLSAFERRGEALGAIRASFGLALSLAALGERRRARRVARDTVRRSEAVGPG